MGHRAAAPLCGRAGFLEGARTQDAGDLLTVEGLPRIIRVATAYLIPFADEFLPRPQSRALIDIVARLVISYFLAPSAVVDFGDETSARRFLVPFLPVLPDLRSPTTQESHA